MKRNSYQKKNWWYEKRDYVYNYEYKVSHDFLLSPTEAGAVCDSYLAIYDPQISLLIFGEPQGFSASSFSFPRPAPGVDSG